MIKIIVCAETSKELFASLKDLAKAVTSTTTECSSDSVSVPATEAPATEPTSRRRGRPKGTTKTAEAAPPTSPATEAAEPAEPAEPAQEAPAEEVEEKSHIDVSKLKEEAAKEEVLDKEAAPTPTFADVKNALKALVETGEKGVAAGHALLTSFGAQRVSALKEEHYAEFMKKAELELKKVK